MILQLDMWFDLHLRLLFLVRCTIILLSFMHIFFTNLKGKDNRSNLNLYKMSSLKHLSTAWTHSTSTHCFTSKNSCILNYKDLYSFYFYPKAIMVLLMRNRHVEWCAWEDLYNKRILKSKKGSFLGTINSAPSLNLDK